MEKFINETVLNKPVKCSMDSQLLYSFTKQNSFSMGGSQDEKYSKNVCYSRNH